MPFARKQHMAGSTALHMTFSYVSLGEGRCGMSLDFVGAAVTFRGLVREIDVGAMEGKLCVLAATDGEDRRWSSWRDWRDWLP